MSVRDNRSFSTESKIPFGMCEICLPVNLDGDVIGFPLNLFSSELELHCFLNDALQPILKVVFSFNFRFKVIF